MPWKNETKQDQRLRLVQAMMRENCTVKSLCEQFGVSRQTAYKYRRRYDRHGRSGLVDQARTNKAPSRYTRLRVRVLAIRRSRPTWGPRKLLYRLRRLAARTKLPSERTVQRWLNHAGLARRIRRKHAGGGPSAGCARANRSNQVWTVDFKGWFHTKNGRKITPLTVRDLYSRYVLTACQTCSPSEKTIRSIFLKLFRRYGPPGTIRSDRGSPFCGTGPHGLTKLSVWWHRLGIKVEYVSRKQGINNNAHEQMHRVLQAEVAACPEANYKAQARALEKWRRRYNQQRPHEALGMRTPASCYRPSKKSLPRLKQPVYPAGWLVRQVKNKGEIMLDGKRVGIGRAYAGLAVGLHPLGRQCFRVYFEQLVLGELTLEKDGYLHTKP